MNSDDLRNKSLVLLISLILVGIVAFLYFIDKSLDWCFEKIFSCIIVNLWVFFIIPALRNSYLFNKDNSLQEWFKIGFAFGASGIIFPILLAPYFGLKYYFK